MQRVGGSIGTAVLAVAVQHRIVRPVHAFHTSFGLLATTALALVVPAAVLTMVLRRTGQGLTDRRTGTT